MCGKTNEKLKLSVITDSFSMSCFTAVINSLKMTGACILCPTLDNQQVLWFYKENITTKDIVLYIWGLFRETGTLCLRKDVATKFKL